MPRDTIKLPVSGSRLSFIDTSYLCTADISTKDRTKGQAVKSIAVKVKVSVEGDTRRPCTPDTDSCREACEVCQDDNLS